MKESIGIEIQTTQGLHIMPRQVLYARLLEMSGPEVEDAVLRQLDDNPALVREGDNDIDSDDDIDYDNDKDADYDIDIDYDNDIDYGNGADSGEGVEYGDGEDDSADFLPAGTQSESAGWQVAEPTPDLMEYLMQQLGAMDVPARTKAIAEYIIGNIDGNGYLTRGLMAMADDIAIATSVDVSMDEMKEAFDVVRSLEPAGVGAVDLRDCLLLQLKRKKPNTFTLKVAKEIVDDHFDLFYKNHRDRLISQLGLDDPAELNKAIDLISKLDPKPGAAITQDGPTVKINHITPDVIAEEDDNGRWTVSLYNRLPQLQIERSFVIDSKETKPANRAQREAQAFVKSKRDSAEAFISALKMRGETLLAVSEAIVKRQSEYMRTGDKSTLKPMILKDISADTGIELSAVSRATAGKYIEAPAGTFSMKSLFNEAPTDDNDASSHKMMDALKKIVDAEDKTKPLSDQAILEAMEKEGYKLARRTVTKYRERQGIPVARLRKK